MTNKKQKQRTAPTGPPVAKDSFVFIGSTDTYIAAFHVVDASNNNWACTQWGVYDGTTCTITLACPGNPITQDAFFYDSIAAGDCYAACYALA